MVDWETMNLINFESEREETLNILISMRTYFLSLTNFFNLSLTSLKLPDLM